VIKNALDWLVPSREFPGTPVALGAPRIAKRRGDAAHGERRRFVVQREAVERSIAAQNCSWAPRPTDNGAEDIWEALLDQGAGLRVALTEDALEK
jgi:hypothetical protein